MVFSAFSGTRADCEDHAEPREVNLSRDYLDSLAAFCDLVLPAHSWHDEEHAESPRPLKLKALEISAEEVRRRRPRKSIDQAQGGVEIQLLTPVGLVEKGRAPLIPKEAPRHISTMFLGAKGYAA